MHTSRMLQGLAIALLLAACGDTGPGNQQTETASPQAAPAEESQCELVMGWDPWEPYQYEIAGGQVLGLDVDLLTAVTNHADCRLSFRKGSWRELLQMLREGEIDILGGATRTPEREQFAWFTEPYRDEQFSLFVAATRLDELRDMSLEQMMNADLQIGVVEDYLYGERISAFQDDSGYQDQFVYSAMSETNLSRLLMAQVDAAIEDKYVGAAIIRHKNLGNDIVPHPMQFTSNPVSIMVSRASVDDAKFERLDASVAYLRENGAIDKVLAQYLNP
ncbi:MAG: amino acid ABC transporter substrate-binding protein [Xanthomonadales bacterium]|nr:amino acid ABC transporter substrate-binding protein [Xanthomonadales bacterium]